MSIYASSFALSDDPDDDGPAPIVYEGSHVLPSDGDPRRGQLDFAHIPGFIGREGRPPLFDPEQVDSDFPAHPQLRVCMESTDPDDENRRCVEAILDRGQVKAVWDYLGHWLDNTVDEADDVHTKRLDS